MFTYKNTSLAMKTFYGVVFKPGDSKNVSGFINDPSMVRVPYVSEKPTKTDAKKSPEPVKKVEQEKSEQSNKSEKQGGESDGSDNNK